MTTFAYSGCDASGRGRKGWIEANSAKRARVLLAGQGILTENLRPASGGRGGLDVSGRERLFRELGALLSAGLPFDRALGVMMQGGDARLSVVAAALRDRVREGETVSTGMEAVCGDVSAFETAVFVAGERSGNLGKALSEIAVVLESRRLLTERLRTALAYPLFVVLLGLAVGGLVSFVLAPRAVAMLEEAHGTAPASALLVVRLSRILLGVVVALGVLLPLLWWFLSRRLARRPDLREKCERLMLRLPSVRVLLCDLWSSRFARALGMLGAAGVPLVEAMSLAGDASGSACVASAVRRESDAVRHGALLSRAMEAVTPISGTLPEWIRIGEATGNMDAMLIKAADRLQSDYERRVAQTMALLDPILIVAIGAFVLVVALAVLLPVLTLARGIVH